MFKAIELAKRAARDGEVPIGALIVVKNKILAQGHNQVERLNDPTAHAEMIAITAACNSLNGKYLRDCTLYVTLEPCVMCAAALRWAQIRQLVFGAYDKKAGFLRVGESLLHPKTTYLGGVLEEECAALLKEFFASKRG